MGLIRIDPFITEVLMDLNMNEYERKALMTILEEGTVVARRISERSGIPYAKVYQILDSLIEKGFILKDDSRPKKFSAINPKISLQRRLEFLENEWRVIHTKRQDNVEKILLDLTILYSESDIQKTSEKGVWSIVGLKNILHRLDELAASVKDRVVLTSEDNDLIDIFLHHIYKSNIDIIIRSDVKPVSDCKFKFIQIKEKVSTTICVFDNTAMLSVVDSENDYNAVLTKMEEMIISYLHDIDLEAS